MKDKYVVIDVSTDDVWFVELTSSQVEAIEWMMDKIDMYTIRFIKIESALKFEEI